ncbi:unnamed protein product [Periconia digitata]|uniref:J domain-containing protein n=1 Tax=Periconia digitata TaxID=1303443 RepID=A0A9W4UGW3_9PLEO|nr:unnamed protein product [Periconia digitata]
MTFPTPDQNHYRTLGILQTSTLTEIRLAYHALIHPNHPDHPDHAVTEAEYDECFTRRVAIQDAFYALNDEERKRTYDADLSANTALWKRMQKREKVRREGEVREMEPYEMESLWGTPSPLRNHRDIQGPETEDNGLQSESAERAGNEGDVNFVSSPLNDSELTAKEFEHESSYIRSARPPTTGHTSNDVPHGAYTRPTPPRSTPRKFERQNLFRPSLTDLLSPPPNFNASNDHLCSSSQWTLTDVVAEGIAAYILLMYRIMEYQIAMSYLGYQLVVVFARWAVRRPEYAMALAVGVIGIVACLSVDVKIWLAGWEWAVNVWVRSGRND